MINLVNKYFGITDTAVFEKEPSAELPTIEASEVSKVWEWLPAGTVLAYSSLPNPVSPVPPLSAFCESKGAVYRCE